MTETGPIYGIVLIERLSVGNGGYQAMPGRTDLEIVKNVSLRTAAGYEVLLAHYQELQDQVFKLRRYLDQAIENSEAIAEGRDNGLANEMEKYLQDTYKPF